MLSLRSWPSEVVTIILHTDQLIINWIKPHKKSSTYKGLPSFELKAHQAITLETTACNQAQIFNLTVLKTHINTFLKTHKIKNAPVAMALSMHDVIEQFVASAIATPDKNNFTFLSSGNLVWDYLYLYPHDDGTFTFYVCGIKQEQLLQYKLLAISANLQLKALLTSRMALLQLYRLVQGPAFRHSQLAVTMQRNNNNIDQLLGTEVIHRLLTIGKNISINFSQQAPHLRTSLGLVLSSDLYERTS